MTIFIFKLNAFHIKSHKNEVKANTTDIIKDNKPADIQKLTFMDTFIFNPDNIESKYLRTIAVTLKQYISLFYFFKFNYEPICIYYRENLRIY
jgi:hypothetical protein